MGRWRITIDGVGCHHNSNRAIDADLAAKDFVGELRKQGHNLEAARFESLGAYVDQAGTTIPNGTPIPDGATYDGNRVQQDAGMNIDLLAATAPTSTPGTHEITRDEFAAAGSS